MAAVMRWLVIGGTSESVDAVSYLVSKKADVTVSVATDMGAGLYRDCSAVLWVGALNQDQFMQKIHMEGITHVLDASHPYAVEVTKIVQNVCHELGVPYFRYTRRDAMRQIGMPEDGKVLMPEIYPAADIGEAVQILNSLPGKIALLTGVKTLEIYREQVDDFQERCYARVLDNEASKMCCREIFENPDHWTAQMPPFDIETNRQFLRKTGAEVVVTKDSGAAGGLPEKLEAARIENASVVLIRRPEEKNILDHLNRLDVYFEEGAVMSRLMFGGTGSGCGKTTVTAAVMKALTDRKMKLAPYKCGPDYIDPMFHRWITGVPSINLDSIFLNPEKLREIFAWHMQGKDIALIEGVMGYYDGQADGSRGSSYNVASITKTPTVLIVRPDGMALSVSALIQGFQNFKKDSMICGVILNGIREGMYTFYQKLIEKETGLKVYGFLPETSEVFMKSRHLGLVTAAEQEQLTEKITLLGRMAEKYIDIEGLMALAQTAGPIISGGPFEDMSPIGEVRLAVAMDEAFCFYYEDNLEVLRRLGAELVPFSPMRDKWLPENIQGIYLGGGYPELHAKILSENETMKASVREAYNKGLPIIAECGGYMYLSESIQTGEYQTEDILEGKGGIWPMVGVVSGNCRMTGKLGPFGYVTGTVQKDSLIGKCGDMFCGHEFHYSVMDDSAGDFVLTKSNGRSWCSGTAGKFLYAAYPHLYFCADLDIAKRFVQAMKAVRYDA